TASYEHTTLVCARAERLEELGILSIAGAIGSHQGTRLEERFEVIENEEAAALAEQLHEQRYLIRHTVGRCGLLLRKGADGLVEHLGERRAVLERAEQHHLKQIRDPVSNCNCQT